MDQSSVDCAGIDVDCAGIDLWQSLAAVKQNEL